MTSALVVAAGVWGLFEARSVGVEHVVIEVDHLPAGMQSLRIAQVSDLHVGAAGSRQRLGAAVRRLQQLRPDIIVSTGDLVDGELHETNHMAEQLAGLSAPLGKYAILGNHEFYSGLADSLTFLSRAGFDVLRQRTVEPVAGLRIVGVDDPAGRSRFGQNRSDELPALPDGPRQDAVVLLKHQPEIHPLAPGRFDVQLSGHTHGGQVFPFGYLTRLRYVFAAGRHDLPSGATLYVSRGTGTWGPPLRLAARPEVTLIELRRRPAR